MPSRWVWSQQQHYPAHYLYLQSVEMKLERNSLSYTSDVVMVPVGEYEGQLIIGNSFIYPVHKFLVVGGKTLVSLEIDISQLEKEQPRESCWD